MGYILAIDIGNTNITAGLFKGMRLLGKTKILTGRPAEYPYAIKRFLKRSSVKSDRVSRVVISSVVPAALAHLKWALTMTIPSPVHIIGKDIIVPIKNLYRIKRQVGQDRLVNAFAAKALYGAPCVIIDSGTAMTFDIVSKKGEYLGGLILPGIEMSLSGLYEKTALLPKVNLKKAAHIIGTETSESMQGGILFGFGAMSDGLISQYKKILGKATKVILTGGNADLIKKYAKSINIVDTDLTLKGLAYIILLEFKKVRI